LPHATWPFEFRKLFPGEINNTADLKTRPALDGGSASIRPRESKPNNGTDMRISRPDRRAARRMPGFGIAVGHLLSPYTDFAVFSMRRFCVENLSNEAAPRSNGRKEPRLVSIPDFALRCKIILEFTA
jgi:hypothetical protein